METAAAAAAAAAAAKARCCHHCDCLCDPPPPTLLGLGELQTWCLYRALIAEFMAALIFLYVSIATVIGCKKQQQSSPDSGGVGFLGVAWSFGATIFVLVYCTKGVSGGHINPAVTFGMVLARKVSLLRGLLYVAAQCLGAICGAGIVKGIMAYPYDSLGGGANTVAAGYSLGGALAAETVGTFILVYTVFSATDTKKHTCRCYIPVLLPLPIGFAVFVVHLATIPITGTGINPARSLGAAVLYNHHAAWKDHWIFWVGPLIGAAAAALYRKLLLLRVRGEDDANSCKPRSVTA